MFHCCVKISVFLFCICVIKSIPVLVSGDENERKETAICQKNISILRAISPIPPHVGDLSEGNRSFWNLNIWHKISIWTLHLIKTREEGGGDHLKVSERTKRQRVHAILLQAFEILLFQMPPVIEANLGAIFLAN